MFLAERLFVGGIRNSSYMNLHSSSDVNKSTLSTEFWMALNPYDKNAKSINYSSLRLTNEQDLNTGDYKCRKLYCKFREHRNTTGRR